MKLMALFYFVLSLFGIDVGGSSYVTRIRADGADTLYSKATAQAGVARFECLRSASGQCYYTVFPRDCAAARASTSATTPQSSRKPTTGCRSAPVQRFAIANGDSRQITGLQGFGLCVSTDAGTAGPDCEPSQPLATR